MKTDSEICGDEDKAQSLISYKWLVGILVTLVLGMSAAWAAETNTRLGKVEDSVAEVKSFMAEQRADHRTIDRRLAELVLLVKELHK